MLRSKISLAILLLLSVATMAFGSTYSEQYIWNSVFDRTAKAVVLYALTGYVPGPHGNTSYSTNWILNQIYDPANKALRSGVVGGSDTTLRGRLVGNVAPLAGEVLGWNGSAWVPMTGVPADSAAFAFKADSCLKAIWADSAFIAVEAINADSADVVPWTGLTGVPDVIIGIQDSLNDKLPLYGKADSSALADEAINADSADVVPWSGLTGVPDAIVGIQDSLNDKLSLHGMADSSVSALWGLRVGKNPMVDPYQDNIWYTYMEALPDTGASSDTTLLVRSIMRSGGSSSIVDVGWFDRSGYNGNLKGSYAETDSSSSDSSVFAIGTIKPYGYIWGADAGGNLKSWLQLDYDGYASLGVVKGFDYMTENATWIFEWDTLNNTYYNIRGGGKISLTQFNNAVSFGWRSVTIFPTPAPYYSVKIKSPNDTTELRVNRDSVIVGGDGDFYSFNDSYLNSLELLANDGGDVAPEDSVLFVRGVGGTSNLVRKGRAPGLGVTSISRNVPTEYTIDTVAVSGILSSQQVQLTWQGVTVPNKPLTFVTVTDTVFVHIDVSDTAKASAEGYVIWRK